MWRFSLVILLSLADAGALGAQQPNTLIMGQVLRFDSTSIVLNLNDEEWEFAMDDATLICLQGQRAPSWRSLQGVAVVTIAGGVRRNYAQEIHNGAIPYERTDSGTFARMPGCEEADSAGVAEGVVPDTAAADPALADSTANEALVLTRAIQELLLRLGYDPGPADGLPGPRTAAAIRAFETELGFAPTGAATPELLRRLRTAAADTIRSPADTIRSRADTIRSRADTIRSR